MGTYERTYIGWSHFKLNEWNILHWNENEIFITEVFFTENEYGKMNFPLGKTKFWTRWEFCACHRIFGFWKSPAG